MDRCAILVDVGHLLAEGGKLCCGTKKRLGIKCDYPNLIAMLVDYAGVHCNLQYSGHAGMTVRGMVYPQRITCTLRASLE
jgi:hypothetical protein